MNFCLKGEFGDTVDEGFIDDGFIFDVLDKVNDPERRCLRYLDQYGNAVFNKMQVEDIVREISRCRSGALSEAEADVLDKLQALCLRVLQEVHVYLWAIGD